MTSAKLSVFCAIFTAVLLGQSRLPPVPGATVLDITPSGGRVSEPSIAVNPNNPNQLVAVYQGGAAVQGSGGAAYSTDAGRTFTPADAAKPADWRVVGDVTAVFDNKGHAFWCYLAFDRLGTSSYWAHNAGRNGIFVRRSLDGGKTWEKDSVAVKAFPTGHEQNLQFEDEPRIFADNSPKSRYAGNLYVGWVEWQIDKSVMLFSRSIDDGQTWSPAMQISIHPGFPRDDNGSLGGFVQTIAPDGAIYAIWDDGNSILLTESNDGGKTFSRPRAVIETGPPYFGEVPGISRVEGFPQIAVDPTTANRGGNIYICWSDYRNGDVDVFISSSADHGRRWSAPVRVNDDPVHNGIDQFYEWLAVDPVTAAVYVSFYDRRGDPANRKIRMTLARSTDGGRTFTNYAWTDTPFEAQGAFLGDYTWLAAHNNRVYGIWTEATGATGQQPPATAGQRRGATTTIKVGVADFSNSK